MINYIDLGTAPNTNTADDARTAGQKINLIEGKKIPCLSPYPKSKGMRKFRWEPFDTPNDKLMLLSTLPKINPFLLHEPRNNFKAEFFPVEEGKIV